MFIHYCFCKICTTHHIWAVIYRQRLPVFDLSHLLSLKPIILMCCKRCSFPPFPTSQDRGHLLHYTWDDTHCLHLIYFGIMKFRSQSFPFLHHFKGIDISPCIVFTHLSHRPLVLTDHFHLGHVHQVPQHSCRIQQGI